MSRSWLCISTIIFRLMTIVTHGLGILLLQNVYKNEDQKPEIIYLINLSISEILFMFTDILRTPFTNFVEFSPRITSVVEETQEYVAIYGGFGIISAWYLSMLHLTLDRLLDVLLNIKYSLFCYPERTKLVIRITWFITSTFGVTMCLLHRFVNFDSMRILVKFVFPCFDFIFIIIAIVTYGIIFHKYRHSRTPPTKSSIYSTSSRVSITDTFRASRFNLPLCLIVTFIFFITIPDFLYSFGVANYQMGTNVVDEICEVSIVLGCCSDGLIYIFLSPSVKRLLMKKLRMRKYQNKNMNRWRDVKRKSIIDKRQATLKDVTLMLRDEKGEGNFNSKDSQS